MLDSTFHPYPKSTNAWTDHVGDGNILGFRFPIRNLCDEIGPRKVRPCLVLNRIERDGRDFLLLCYGTSVTTSRASGRDISVWDPGLAAACGLRKPTRFDGGRRSRDLRRRRFQIQPTSLTRG